jgi:methionyl-tRNA formyltransferase
MTRAVVFAYHNVGVRCLRVLLAHEVDVRLVVTHVDDPHENRWFASVADVAPNAGSRLARRTIPTRPTRWRK